MPDSQQAVGHLTGPAAEPGHPSVPDRRYPLLDGTIRRQEGRRADSDSEPASHRSAGSGASRSQERGSVTLSSTRQHVAAVPPSHASRLTAQPLLSIVDRERSAEPPRTTEPWANRERVEVNGMIRRLKSGEYRLYSSKTDPRTGKRRNLGTFPTREAAERHER